MRKRKITRSFTAILAILLIATACIGTTVAYLIDKTDEVKNVFNPSSVPPEIHEEINGGVKNNVRIENTGNVSAYVRAAVVFTWRDADGNICPEAPKEGTDYTIQWSGLTDGTWVKGLDGYYYYKSAVPAGGTTSVLFTGCDPVETKTPQGYQFSVEIITSTIQAEPTDVVKTQWGVTLGGTTITGGAQ